MKKFLLLIAILSAFPASAQIPEGAIVKTASSPDVYIVKYLNGKQYRRLVLNPLVFKSYGHLKWENLLTISNEEMNAFRTSNLVRVDGSSEIYELAPDGDSGKRVKLESSDFWGMDLDSAYTINAVDFGNYADNGIRHIDSRAEIAALKAASDAKKAAEKAAEAKAEADYVAAVEEEKKLEANSIALEKITNLVKSYNNQLESLSDKMDDKNEEMEDLTDEYSDVIDLPQTTVNSYYGTNKYYAYLSRMDECNGKMKILLDSYDRIKTEYDTVLAKKNKIATIFYEITDYLDHGIVVPAADRAYLISLGIDFKC